jgi:hypothetical protein
MKFSVRKEPLILLSALVLLGGSVVHWWSTCPDALPNQEPLSHTASAERSSDYSPSTPDSLDAVLSKDRATPFAPIKPVPPPPLLKKVVVQKIDPPPVQNKKPVEKPLPAKDPRLVLAFMGILRTENGTMALLKATDSASVYRVRENETINTQDSKYTTTKIDTRSIELRDENGVSWTLTDGAFDPKR